MKEVLRLIKNSGRIYLFLLLFLCLTPLVNGQDYSRYNWYFGNSPYGILFNKSDDLANQTDTQSTPFGDGASAVASDRISGDLLFYTDGEYVYDGSHAQMLGWSGLNANTSANQSVAISPMPNASGWYYIFTNTANYPASGNIFYSTVNMNAVGNASASQLPLGEVVSQNIPAFTAPTQVSPGMLVLETGNDPYLYFLLIQDATTGEYKLYRIDGNNRVLVHTLANPTNIIAANFSYHPQSGQIAVSPNNQGANIQILNFDKVSTLSFIREIPNSGNFDTANEAIYDTEFSQNSTTLFISRHGDGTQPGVLYRYDLNDSLASLDQVNPNPLFQSFGIQVAPDGGIYHLYQENNGGPIQVGRITNPNDTSLSNIIYETVALGNDDYASRQFSSFAPKAPIVFSPNTFEIVNQNTCERSPTKFFPDFDPPADFYRWDFGEPGSPSNNSNLIAPLHTYTAPGSYQVTLVAGINGSIDSVTQFVNVIAMPDSVDLGQDTVICPGETLVLDAGPNGQLYRWSTGESGQTITVDSSNATGYFWVVADYGACSSYDGINVEEFGEQIQIANYWYFGNRAGIDFNEQPPVPVSDGMLVAPEGAASISEGNGENLFYTDGVTVYDQDHNQMFNGTNIGGENNSTQSSIIIPFPNDETLFYIFTTKSVYNPSDYVLSYSVVDIKEIGNGTVGEVVTQDKPLFEKTTERMTATNPGGFVWLIAHELGNNTFRSYPITDQGIGNPVLSSIGSSHDLNEEVASRGYMKLSSDGSRLAVALTSGGKNYVEIFDFDGATGTLSNFLQIELPDDNPPYQVYGVEFASNSEKLFVSANGSAAAQSKLYELKLHNYVKDSVENSLAELFDEPGINMGAIQTGPDGQIYVARDGEQFLGTITENLDTLTNSTYMPGGFDLASGRSSLGLPNFVQSYFQQTPSPSATVIPACITQTSTFIGMGTSIIDEFLWTFGDGGSATTDSASHVYLADSIYTVAFNVSNRCGLDSSIVQLVDISGFPDDATIPLVDVICDGLLVLDADTTNSGGMQFIWSTGETTQSIQVALPGDYSVRIINAAGCESEDTTMVFDGRPLFDLGPNITICQGDSIPPLDTGLPGGSPPNTFTWYRDGLNQNSNTSSLAVDATTPGIFEYAVNVIDGLTGCVNDDTITVTINATPQATYAVTNSSCGNTNGQIDVTSPLTNLTAEWFDPTNVSIGLGTPSPLIAAGTYTLLVTDNVSLCDVNYTIGVIDSTVLFTITPTVRYDCSGDTLDVVLGVITDPSTIIYTLIDSLVGTTTSGIPNAVNFEIPISNSGIYNLQIQADGCTDQFSNIVVNPRTNLDLLVSPIFDICTDNAVIVATSADAPALEWTGPNGFSATVSSGSSVNVSLYGSGQYFVTALDGDNVTPCDTTAVTQVNLETSPDPTITPLTDGCDGTRQIGITGLTGANYSYLWSTASTSPSITVTVSNQYDVIVRDQNTGCQGDDTLQVEVYEPLNVALTVDQQACEDGNLVTLTATAVPTQAVSYEWFLNNAKLNNTSADLPTSGQGLYQATITDVATGNCQATGDLQITRAPVTISTIDPLYVICPEPPANEVAVIEPGNFLNYYGFNLETGGQIYETLPGIFEIVEEGIYNFELENEFNCWTLDTTRVDVDCVPVIYAPTAFSPFASIPENTTFKLFPTYVGDFHIYIYNRWGELVFYSDDIDFMINQGWDGTKNGELLKLGTYAYVIKFKSINEPERGVIEQAGGVTLVR